MPIKQPPTGRSILKVLVMVAILAFILVAFWGGSPWDLWFMLSLYVSVWSLVGTYLNTRSGWLTPLL
jgi:hypothetical protein